MIQLREGDIYRKELIKMKLNLSVESLLKSKKLEKKTVKFDLSPLDNKILHQVINKKEINLVKDEKSYDFLETLWGPFWEVPKTRCNRKGKTFQFVKYVKINRDIASCSLTVRMKKEVSTIPFSVNYRDILNSPPEQATSNTSP